MPRMQGAAVQCCMCIVGLFMFLGGVIMLATGISLILNYGVFDITLLPPDLNNEEGKKTVGIILTVCGLMAIIISVIVSLLYLCNKSKTSSINPDELSRIPSSARNTGTPDSRQGREQRRTDRDRRQTGTNGVKAASNGGARGPHTTHKNIPGSAEVRLPRAHKHGKKMRSKYPRHSKGRLEEIKEDAISRKTVDGILEESRDGNGDTPRSDSMSSQLTIDEASKIPKVVLDEYNERPSSVNSTSTSMTSESSSRFGVEQDKSRREFQFMNNAVRKRDYSNRPSDIISKDSVSLERYDENSLTGNTNYEEYSITSEFTTGNVSALPHRDFTRPVDHPGQPMDGGVINYGADVQTSSVGDLGDSEGTTSATSFKASHYTEVHGEHTSGRMSPQIGEPETYTRLEERTLGSNVSLGSKS